MSRHGIDLLVSSRFLMVLLAPAANGGFRNGAGCLGQPAEEWAPAMA